MIRLFCGYDRREAAGFHIFVESVIRNSSEPVSIIPIFGAQLDGTNAFTYARFLVPHLCNFEGTAIFMDGSDMLVRTDLAQLSMQADPRFAVQVVKHDYRTKHPRKYLGTDMESDNRNYTRKNWSSVMLWNCAHPKHRWMTPERIRDYAGGFLHQFGWLEDKEIGDLDPSWNVLIGEEDSDRIALAHFTLGIPAIPAYSQLPYSEEWRMMQRRCLEVPHATGIT